MEMSLKKGRFSWLEKREQLFAPAAGSDTSRLIDVIALRGRWPTAAADATAPELENVEVPPPPEFLEKTATLDTERTWRRKCSMFCLDGAMKAIIGHRASQHNCKSRAPAAPQFFKKESETGKLQEVMEVHMDDRRCPSDRAPGNNWQPRTPRKTPLLAG